VHARISAIEDVGFADSHNTGWLCSMLNTPEHRGGLSCNERDGYADITVHDYTDLRTSTPARINRICDPRTGTVFLPRAKDNNSDSDPQENLSVMR
jgi:hypothetical protein